MSETVVRVEDSLDTGRLLETYRASVTPAAKKFVEGKSSASELRTVWLEYFRGDFLAYEMAVHDAWREAFGPDRGVAAGTPLAGPEYAEVLRHFPVTIAHNNLERLVDVLQVQLGDSSVRETPTPERIIDFAYVIDELDRLMQSLVQH